jgi:hypothetical protein
MRNHLVVRELIALRALGNTDVSRALLNTTGLLLHVYLDDAVEGHHLAICLCLEHLYA